MTELAKVVGSEITYPVTRAQMIAAVEAASDEENFEYCPPLNLSEVELPQGFVTVEPRNPPEVPTGKIAERDGIAQQGGKWGWNWKLVDLAPSVPEAVTRRQAKLALHAGGLLAEAESKIALLPLDAQIEWADAAEFRRDHPLIAAIGTALGLTDAQIDALFISANAI